MVLGGSWWFLIVLGGLWCCKNNLETISNKIVKFILKILLQEYGTDCLGLVLTNLSVPQTIALLAFYE